MPDSERALGKQKIGRLNKVDRPSRTADNVLSAVSTGILLCHSPERRTVMPVPISLVPWHFRRILQRIEQSLNADLEVNASNNEWLHFSIGGYADREAMREIERRKAQVLVGVDAARFRIVCPWSRSSGNGLWLHSLMHCESPHEYLRGNCYY